MTSQEATRKLLAHLADYWVERELCFVKSPAHIREPLQNFNSAASQFPDIGLRAFKYWVYDPSSNTFGPNKFVGFQCMTFPKYTLAGIISEREMDRGRFNGTRAKNAIQKALKAYYQVDSELCRALEEWAGLLFGDASVFAGRNRSIWEFVRLR